MEPAVLVEHPSDGVVRIILNRPKALNAINAELLDSLVDALRTHTNARVILLEGAGERSFCAGEDLKQSLAPTGSPQELKHALGKLQDVTRLTSSAEPVVVAAVQGFAIGGGAEIALAADFVIGGPAAKFRFPEVPIGHAATGGITLRLPHLVGLLRAKELLLTGRWVDSDEALRIGLLTEVSEDPKGRALELALQLAGLPSSSLVASKTSLERATFFNMESCLAEEVHAAKHCFAQSDASKAFKDFAARKAPPPQSNDAPTARDDKKPAIKNINTAWRQAVESFPDRVFLRFADRDVTFQEVESLVASLAGGLKGAGIVSGDRVLVLMKNSIEMVVTWLASNRLGAVWVPVNAELRSVTLQHVIEAAAPKLAIVDGELWPELEPLWTTDKNLIYVKDNSNTTTARNFSDLLSASPSEKTSEDVSASTTAAFLYTSGSTGRSKPCVLSHEYFLLQAKGLIESCGLQSDDVLYCPFPLYHVDATALTVIPAILLGVPAALSARYSASRFWDEIQASRATVCDFMGATLALTYKQPPSPADRDHRVRLAWGVPIPHFAEDYEKRFGHRLVTLYGSVESGLPVFQDLEKPLPPGSCGRARKGYEVRIADDAGEALPPNTPGHLLLRSDRPNAVFMGYFNNAPSTVEAFKGLWLHTGDLAKVDEDGNIYFIGRTTDVIRRRGTNINACEVEEELLRHPDVVVAAAYGVASELGAGTEQDVKVAVQLRPESQLTEQQLWEWAVEHMARFQVPSIIEFVENIEKTSTGKIAKSRLRAEGGQPFDIRQQLRA